MQVSSFLRRTTFQSAQKRPIPVASTQTHLPARELKPQPMYQASMKPSALWNAAQVAAITAMPWIATGFNFTDTHIQSGLLFVGGLATGIAGTLLFQTFQQIQATKAKLAKLTKVNPEIKTAQKPIKEKVVNASKLEVNYRLPQFNQSGLQIGEDRISLGQLLLAMNQSGKHITFMAPVAEGQKIQKNVRTTKESAVQAAKEVGVLLTRKEPDGTWVAIVDPKEPPAKQISVDKPNPIIIKTNKNYIIELDWVLAALNKGENLVHAYISPGFSLNDAVANSITIDEAVAAFERVGVQIKQLGNNHWIAEIDSSVHEPK
jgi:hypothetical protein